MTDPEMVSRILELRDRFPTWGGRKLRTRLIRDGLEGTPAASTITEILRREGRLTKPLRPQRDLVRFQADHPNDLWQMDFKGDFALGDGSRCFPLTIIDDHSRFVPCLAACPDQQRDTIQTHLIATFTTYGQPKCILCDNGPPWGSSRPNRYTRLGVWLIEHGIAVSHGRPHHPQTQGKDERFHRTLNQDLITTTAWENHPHIQHAFDTWLPTYNTYRPHHSLNGNVPADHYQPSPRPYTPTPPEPDYPNPRHVRRVHNGRINYHNTQYRVGHAFETKHVQVHETDTTITITYYTTPIRTHPKGVTHEPEHL